MWTAVRGRVDTAGLARMLVARVCAVRAGRCRGPCAWIGGSGFQRRRGGVTGERGFTPGLRHVLLLGLLFLVVVGCGSDEASAPSSSEIEGSGAVEVDDGGIKTSLIASPDRTYTIDDLVAAGWKKSAELSTETLPSATEVWYGFFRQKDIEVRVYASHEDAEGFGVAPARATIDPDPSARGGDHGPWTPNIAQYGAYAVVGNLVMLCELELAACEALVEALD